MNWPTSSPSLLLVLPASVATTTKNLNRKRNTCSSSSTTSWTVLTNVFWAIVFTLVVFTHLAGKSLSLYLHNDLLFFVHPSLSPFFFFRFFSFLLIRDMGEVNQKWACSICKCLTIFFLMTCVIMIEGEMISPDREVLRGLFLSLPQRHVSVGSSSFREGSPFSLCTAQV